MRTATFDSHETALVTKIVQSACCHPDWTAREHAEYVISECPDVPLYSPLAEDKGLLVARIQEWLDAWWFQRHVESVLNDA